MVNNAGSLLGTRMRGARVVLRRFWDLFTISQHRKRKECGQGYRGAWWGVGKLRFLARRDWANRNFFLLVGGALIYTCWFVLWQLTLPGMGVDS